MSRTDYRKVLTIAARLRNKGFLKRFKTDLVKHDKRALSQTEGPFLWAIYDQGTHLSTKQNVCNRRGSQEAWRDLPRMFPGVKMFYSAGGGATPKPVNALLASKIVGGWERSCPRR